MKRRVTMLSLSFLPLLALAIVTVAFLQPFSAGAAPAVNAQVRAHAHLLATKHAQATRTSPGNNLQYNGGPVMGGIAQVYAIFWEPKGSFVSPTYNNLILRYFGDVGGSPLYHNNTQYPDAKGNIPSNASLAGSWVDTARYPSKRLSDFNIQQEVGHALNVNGWKSGIDNIFFVFTAKGENICAGGACSFSTFCAYHSFFGTNTIYAAMPYTGTNLAACGVPHSPNHDFDADSTINVTSHEQMEAATDPLINAWLDVNGNEIGDKCAWIFGPLNKQGGDVLWGSDAYEVQEEWDNNVSGCVLSGP